MNKVAAFSIAFFSLGCWYTTWLTAYSSNMKAVAGPFYSVASSNDDRSWNDFWWMSQFKETSLRLDDDGMIVFPANISRVWIDVGVHRKSQFMNALTVQTDLFVLGFEPTLAMYHPCEHERCVVLWAACTPKAQTVELNIQGFKGQCNSLLRPNTNTTAGLKGVVRGCVMPEKDETGRDRKYKVPGIPLSQLLSRIPTKIDVEFIKIDAQGYDLEVMKGVLLPQPGMNPKLPHVVSLEAIDVKDKSQLLYQGQPTLDEVKEFLQGAGWTFVSNTPNTASLHEVNAYFALNESFAFKVASLQKSK